MADNQLYYGDNLDVLAMPLGSSKQFGKGEAGLFHHVVDGDVVRVDSEKVIPVVLRQGVILGVCRINHEPQRLAGWLRSLDPPLIPYPD